MLRWIVGTSLKYRFLVIAIALGIMYFGLRQLNKMPVDVFPEFAPPRVEIQTPCLGLSPSEVEGLVTVPLEEMFNGLPGLDVMRSKSVPQLSSILMIFEPGTDVFVARQAVTERMNLALPSLPTWAAPPIMLQPLSATSRCMKIGMSSEKFNVMELSMMAYWTIRPRLLAVPGVANVAIWGDRMQMLQVQVDPHHLATMGVTLDQVQEGAADALRFGLLQYSDGAMIGTGGFIDTPNQRLGITHVLPVKKAVDLGQVPIVREKDGKPLRLNQVATLVEDHQPMVGDAIINDDIGLLLIVEKYPWGNTLQLTKGVDEALESLRAGLPGVEIDAEIFRPATFIDMSIKNLTQALLFGCLLVILVLFAFLYEWRVALISCIAIPLSLMAGAIVLYLQGTTINTMILAGFIIALGAVVDDAIVDVENITRRLRQHRKEGKKLSIGRIILEASFEVRHAIIFSTLIEVAALLPVFVMEGLSGAFFQPLALSYAIAIAASTVVALTVTPALSLILLRNAPLKQHESPLVKVLHRGYNWILSRTLKRPRPAYFTVAIIVLAGLVVLPQLGQELLPSFKERDFLMHWLTKPGTSLPEMQRITKLVSKELRSIPGVRNFGAHIGQTQAMDEVVGIYFGENWISVDPSVDYDETIAKIQETVDGYPGLYRDVLTYLKERIREVLTGSHETITVRIYGHELSALRSKAEEIRQALSKIDGMVEIHVELITEIPQIEIEVDLAAARRYGIKPGDVRRAAAALIAGNEVSDLHRGGKVYEVQLWSTPKTRHSLTSVRELLIDLPGGGHVRLENVAEVNIRPTPNVIKRENSKRRLDVGGNVRGRDLGSVVEDVDDALQKIEFPLGYHVELIGEYAEREAVQNRMLGWAIIALIGIFVLLYTSFKSARLALLAFLLLPSALVGGVLAAYFGSGIISLGSLVGFLTVLGIAARNGILMINHFQHLEKYEGEIFGVELVRRGAQERLAPILMTAITTGLALMPLVIAGNIPGHEIELPMAVVILGGLVTSTLLNLLIIPALYLRFKGKAVASI